MIGEDGADGIKIGSEYPGAAYLGLQRALLDLNRRGIIPAVASKNNPADALEVLDRHPSMLVLRAHFSALEIGWNAKPGCLRRIAAEFYVGLDSLVFIDDNPVERDAVRRELPEVLVPELPTDPMRLATCLREVPGLDRVRIARGKSRPWSKLRAFEPDVVVTNGFNPTHLLAYAYSRLHGVRHVAMSDGRPFSEGTLSWLHHWMRRWAEHAANYAMQASTAKTL